MHNIAGGLAADVHRGALDRPSALRCRGHCAAAHAAARLMKSLVWCQLIMAHGSSLEPD